MNIREIFEKAENGTLTFEQFESIMKQNNAKFADLSEGNYVSKSKYESDLSAKDSMITSLNTTITQRDTDLATLKKDLENAGTDATKLTSLQGQFDSLQTKYTQEVADYQSRLATQQYEFAVKEFANTKNFTSKAAKRDFTNAMISAKLTFDANKQKIIGADDFVSSYSEENNDAFVVDTPPATEPPKSQPPKPQFAGPTSNQQQPNNETSAFGFSFAKLH